MEIDPEILSALVIRCRQEDSMAQHDLWKVIALPLQQWVRKKFPKLQLTDARAVACESFAEALLKLKKFRGDASFTTWLIAIAGNIAKDYLKESARHADDVPVEEVLPQVFRRRSHRPDAPGKDRRLDMLKEALDILTPEQSFVVRSLQSGLKRAEIAALLRKSVAAVDKLWARALERLRGLLAVPHEVDPPGGRGRMRRMTDEERCAAALGEFTDLLVDGRAPSVDEFLLGFPDLQARLRPLLESAVVMFDAFEAARQRKNARRGPSSR